MTPSWASRLRLPLTSRFSTRTLADHVRRYPNLAYVTDDGKQYSVAGPWRRRSDVAELIEVTRGDQRQPLVRAIEAALRDLGVSLMVMDYGGNVVEPGLIDDLGLGVVERIVEYERPNSVVGPHSSTLPIRRYTAADRDAILELERHSFPWLWWNSQEEWDAYASSGAVQVIVGRDRGRVVGYAGFTVYHRDGHLDRLAVHEDFQGRGFGAALLVESLSMMERAGARHVRLTTQEDNVRSQMLYERYGFRRGRWVYEIYGKWLNQPEGWHS